MIHQLLVSIQVRPEDEHSRVEAIRPADIWSSGQLFTIKQFITVLNDQGVGIQEDTLGVLGESPAPHLGRQWSRFLNTDI